MGFEARANIGCHLSDAWLDAAEKPLAHVLLTLVSLKTCLFLKTTSFSTITKQWCSGTPAAPLRPADNFFGKLVWGNFNRASIAACWYANAQPLPDHVTFLRLALHDAEPSFVMMYMKANHWTIHTTNSNWETWEFSDKSLFGQQSFSDNSLLRTTLNSPVTDKNQDGWKIFYLLRQLI